MRERVKIGIIGGSKPNTGSGKYAFKLYETLMYNTKDKDINYFYFDKNSLKKYDENNQNIIIAKTKKAHF